jgi:hypothetical protein
MTDAGLVDNGHHRDSGEGWPVRTITRFKYCFHALNLASDTWQRTQLTNSLLLSSWSDMGTRALRSLV